MPAESVAFTYNGTDTVVATITNAENGKTYNLTCRDPDSSLDSDTASGSTLVLTVSDVGGGAPGERFRVAARKQTPGNVFMGDTVFEFGSTEEFAYTATWDYDGSQVVSVTFTGDISVDDYNTDIDDSSGGGSASSEPGIGSAQIITNDPGSPQADDYFEVRLYSEAIGEDQPFKVRLFTPGVAGAGFAGNPDVPSIAFVLPLFFVAFDDPTLEADPTWTQLG